MKKFKKLFMDLVYGVVGLVVMNAVLSLGVYPYLGKTLGAAAQGRILFFTSLMSLMAGTFGSGANYGRMKIYAAERETENGEYNIFLLLTALVITAVTIAAILIKGDSAGASWIGIIVLIIATTVRYYADVQYRLSLNYKRFSIYYLVIAAGYGLGLLIYQAVHSWVLILLTGEVFGLVFVILTGNIFRPPFFRWTKRSRHHLRTLTEISISYLLSDFVASADRLILPLLLTNGDEMTSMYYYASLVGKMMSLLSTPLNGVISGHIAKSEQGLTRKLFLKLCGLMLALWCLVTGVSVLGSHIFVYLFYHQYYADVKALFLLANAGQVIFFICNTMMVIVLRYTNEKYQFIISIVYIALFFAVSIPLILNFGLWGMAWGIFIVNTLKFGLYAVLGLIGLAKEEKKANG